MPRDDSPAPAAPCPTCLLVPEVTAEEFGRAVRCEGCGTLFRAVAAPPAEAPADVEPPDAAESADAPRPRSPRNPYDDGYGRFDEEHTPGRVVALATMHFVYCGLLSVCGILSSVFLEVYPKALPGPDVARGAKTFVHIIHVLMVLAALVPLVAGIQTLRKRPTARVWTIIALVVAGVLLVLNLVQVVLNLPAFTGVPGETSSVMCGASYQLLFWLGYMIPVGVLLASAGKE